MPTINIQELFEKFMQDPEYIGKEELALAEAKHRAIQSMNNHKALSMAKMDSPVDDLLEFLIRKGADDFIVRDGDKFFIHSPQANQASKEEIFQHLKEELLHLGTDRFQAEGAANKLHHPVTNPDGAEWEDVVRDPVAFFQGGTDTGQLSDSHRLLDKLRPGMPGLEPEPTSDNPNAFRYEVPRGQDAINELEKRLAHLPEAHPTRQLFNKLKGSIKAYNGIQGQLDNTKQVPIQGMPIDDFDTEQAQPSWAEGDQESNVGFGQRPFSPEGEQRQQYDLSTTPQKSFKELLDENHFVGETEDGVKLDSSLEGIDAGYKDWKNALEEVVNNRNTITGDISASWPQPSSKRDSNGRLLLDGRIQPKLGNELDSADKQRKGIQDWIESKAKIISGRSSFDTPHEALEYLQEVADNPSRFLPNDSPYQGIHTGDGDDRELSFIHNGQGTIIDGEGNVVMPGSVEGAVGERLRNRSVGERTRTNRLAEIARHIEDLTSEVGEEGNRHVDNFNEPERVEGQGSMAKIPFSPPQNKELETIRHPEMSDDHAQLTFRTRLATEFERDRHTDHTALGQLISHLKEEGNFDSDSLTGDETEQQLNEWMKAGDNKTVNTDLKAEATPYNQMGMNQLVEAYLNGDIPFEHFDQMAHLGANSGRFSDEEARTLAQFDVSLNALNPKGEVYARSRDPGTNEYDYEGGHFRAHGTGVEYEDESNLGGGDIPSSPEQLVGEDVQQEAFEEAEKKRQGEIREAKEGLVEAPGEKYTATPEEISIINDFDPSSGVRSTDSPLVYLDHASTFNADGTKKLDSQGRPVTPRWKLWDVAVPSLDDNGKVSYKDRQAIQEKFWDGTFKADGTKNMPESGKDENIKAVRELAEFQQNMGRNISEAPTIQREQLGINPTRPGQSPFRRQRRGNIPDHASLIDGDKFDNEHEIILPNDEAVKDYEQYRDVMASLVNAGVPIDMITHQPGEDDSGAGERMWTREAMIQGMQNLGVLNYGEGQRDARIALVDIAGGQKRRYFQGHPPVFPGEQDIRPLVSEAQRIREVDEGIAPRVLQEAETHPARLRRENWARIKGEGREPQVEFSPTDIRNIKSAWSDAHPTGVGKDLKVQGLKNRPKNEELASPPSTRPFKSSGPRLKWLKRDGKETEKDGSIIQDTGKAGFKDSQYLDRLINKAISSKENEESLKPEWVESGQNFRSFEDNFNNLLGNASNVLRRRNYELHSGIDDPAKKGVATGKIIQTPYTGNRPGVENDLDNSLPPYIQNALDAYNAANRDKVGFIPITEPDLIPNPEIVHPAKRGGESTDAEYKETARANNLLKTILKTDFGTQTRINADGDEEFFTSPSSHQGTDIRHQLNTSFANFVAGRKDKEIPLTWDAVHDWASSEDMAHYFPDGVTHVTQEFPGYTPSDAENARHEVSNPGSTKASPVARGPHGQPVYPEGDPRKVTLPGQGRSIPTPISEEERASIAARTGSALKRLSNFVKTPPGTPAPTVAEVQEVVKPIQDIVEKTPPVQRLLGHVEDVVRETPPNERISPNNLSALVQYVEDIPLLSGDIISPGALAGEEQSPESRVVEGTSRLINGDSDVAAERQAAEPSAEEQHYQYWAQLEGIQLNDDLGTFWEGSPYITQEEYRRKFGENAITTGRAESDPTYWLRGKEEARKKAAEERQEAERQRSQEEYYSSAAIQARQQQADEAKAGRRESELAQYPTAEEHDAGKRHPGHWAAQLGQEGGYAPLGPVTEDEFGQLPGETVGRMNIPSDRKQQLLDMYGRHKGQVEEEHAAQDAAQQAPVDDTSAKPPTTPIEALEAFKPYEGPAFGDRQYSELYRHRDEHFKAVEEGYEGAEPQLEHFKEDGSRTEDAPVFAHDRKFKADLGEGQSSAYGTTWERHPAYRAWVAEQARTAAEEQPTSTAEETPAAETPAEQPAADEPPARKIRRVRDEAGVKYITEHGELIPVEELTPTERRSVSLYNFRNHSGGANGADQAWDDIGQEFGVKSHHYHIGHYDHDMTRNQVDDHNNNPETESGDELIWYPPSNRHTDKVSDATRNDIQNGTIDEQLQSIAEELEGATGQQWPTEYWNEKEQKFISNEANRNLIRRNVEQVRMSDGVFAISNRIINNKYAGGGTGWAVEYAKRHGNIDGDKEERNFIPIHVFDISRNKWQTWNRETEQFEDTPTGIPRLTANFAGIGARGNLSPEERDKPEDERDKYNTDIPQKAKDAIRAVYEKTSDSPGDAFTQFNIPRPSPTAETRTPEEEEIRRLKRSSSWKKRRLGRLKESGMSDEEIEAHIASEDAKIDPLEEGTDDFSDVASSMSDAADKLGLNIRDKKNWSDDDINNYSDELLRVVLSRAKNETARNYIKTMVNRINTVGRDGLGGNDLALSGYREEASDGDGFSNLGLFNNGSTVGRLENFLQSWGREHNISIGEMAQWGNNNGNKWGFTKQSRWKTNAGEGQLVEPGKRKASPLFAQFDPESIKDADEQDIADMAKLDTMKYERYPHLQKEGSTAREKGMGARSQQDHEEQSIGRANRHGVPHDNPMLKAPRNRRGYLKEDGTSRNEDGHQAYVNDVNGRVKSLADHMHENGYHDEGYDHDTDAHGINKRLLALASEVSRSKVTDRTEALRILTSADAHPSGNTGVSHAEHFHNTDSYTSGVHDKLHNNATVPDEETPPEETGAGGAEEPAETTTASEDGAGTGSGGTPPPSPTATGTEQPENGDTEGSGKKQTLDELMQSEEFKKLEPAAQIGEISNHPYSSDQEKILAFGATLSKPEEEEKEEPPKPTTGTVGTLKDLEQSDEFKNLDPQQKAIKLIQHPEFTNLSEDEQSEKIKTIGNPPPPTGEGFKEDSPLHVKNWIGRLGKNEDADHLMAALEDLKHFNHDRLGKLLRRPEGRKRVLNMADEENERNLHEPEDKAPEATRADKIESGQKAREGREQPRLPDTLFDQHFDVDKWLTEEHKAALNYENTRPEREAKQIAAQKPTSLQSRIDARLAVGEVDPQISTREATEQLRHVLGQGHQLSLIGGNFEPGGDYQKHYEELFKLHDEAIAHGADVARLNKEIADHTKDGEVQSSFGSSEHLAAAQAYHDRFDAHTAEYKSLFDSGSQKAVDAWNDEHYHPNARITQESWKAGTEEEPVILRDKYDPSSKKWNTSGDGITSTYYANRHNNIGTDYSAPPHILGLSPDQRKEYDSLHKDTQENDLPASLFNPDLANRKTNLENSMIESGHLTEEQRGTEANPLNHPEFGASVEKQHRNNLVSGLDDTEADFEIPDGHHYVPGVGHVNTEAVNNIQSALKPGEAFYHAAANNTGTQDGAKRSIVSNPDGSDSGKSVMVDHNGVHAVGSITSEASHESHGPITNQHIRETDLASGLHVATGNATGVPHENVTEHGNGYHIKNVSQTLADSGSHFGTSTAAADQAPKPPEPSIASKAGGALGRFAGRVGQTVKPAADTFARAYAEGDGMPASSVKQQTFKGVAQRGLTSLLGKAPVGESIVAKITGMTPTQASKADTALRQPENLEKLLKFVKSIK